MANQLTATGTDGPFGLKVSHAGSAVLHLKMLMARAGWLLLHAPYVDACLPAKQLLKACLTGQCGLCCSAM